MSHGDYIIKIKEVNGNVTKIKEEKLVNNGNAHSFDVHLQTGDGDVAQLTSSTDNYSPTDWASKKNFVISASTPINITGFLAGEDWEEKRIVIAEGSSAITFTNDDSSSIEANQMYCHLNANIVGAAKDIFVMVYDPTSTKWRIK